VDGRLFEQHDVACEVARHLLFAHGMAAVFDDDDFLVVALHVRQRLGENAGLVSGRDVHGSCSCGARRAVVPAGATRRKGRACYLSRNSRATAARNSAMLVPSRADVAMMSGKAAGRRPMAAPTPAIVAPRVPRTWSALVSTI